MKVKATKPGFLNRLHAPGEKPFNIDPKQFSESWMEKVDGRRKKAEVQTEEQAEEPVESE